MTSALTDRISQRDYNVIQDIVRYFSACESCEELFQRLEKIFGSDITPAHYIVFGVVIGEMLATENADNKLSNILSLCQRQN